MTEGSPNPSETGQKAASIKEQVKAFASIEDEAARGQKLAAVAAFLVDEADRDTMDSLVSPESPFQGRFSEAVTRTLETPIKIHEDAAPVEGWRGHGTAVALTSDGEVVGTFNRPTGLEDLLPDGTGDYGDLRRYALIKAMCSLHLEKSGKTGGIWENFDYLKNFGLTPRVHLFTGEADKPVKIDGKTVHVAGSGLEATLDTIASFSQYAHDLQEPPVPKRESLAGHFDRLASNRIARNLINPSLSGEPIVIPPSYHTRDN